MREPLRELAELEVRPYLDGETPPWHDPEHFGGYYTPDGLPMDPDLSRAWSAIGRFKTEPRNFRRTEFAVEGSTEIAVSTVYLGLDHQFRDGPALFWETMIFGGPAEDYQWRYATRAAAMLGHQQVVDTLAKMLGNPPQVEVELPVMLLRNLDGEHRDG